jgi:uroporphyrinogen-III synthase
MPLQGKRVLVTRAAHQAGELAGLLRDYGAEPLLYPCIAIQGLADHKALDQALAEAAQGAFDWLVLSSVNTVEALAQRLSDLHLSLAGIAAAAVGPTTAQAARDRLDLEIKIIPDEYISEALAEALNPGPGVRIFLPQADIAAPDLSNALTGAGAEVLALRAYCTVLGQGGVDLAALLRAGQVDALTFTSAAIVSHCILRLQDEGGDPVLLYALPAACIGPKTAHAAADLGLRHVLVPESYTLAAMLALLDRAS